MANFKHYMPSVYKEAGRQRIQLRSVKSILLRIEPRFRYEILYDVSFYIKLFQK